MGALAPLHLIHNSGTAARQYSQLLVLGGGEDGGKVGGGGERYQRAGAAVGRLLEAGGRVLPKQREDGAVCAAGQGERALSVSAVLD